MIFWIAILQILRLAKLIEAQHFENFKTEGRRPGGIPKQFWRNYWLGPWEKR